MVPLRSFPNPRSNIVANRRRIYARCKISGFPARLGDTFSEVDSSGDWPRREAQNIRSEIDDILI